MDFTIPYYFKLDDDGNPVACSTMSEWANWFSKADRVVEQTTFTGPPNILVSTVFLGLNHCFEKGGEPLFWETLIFVNGDGGPMWRCGGPKANAVAQHDMVLSKLICGEVEGITYEGELTTDTILGEDD